MIYCACVQIYHYGTEAMKGEAERQRLFYDVFYTVAPEQAWEGVMRLRCSKGVSVNGTNVYGNFHIRSTDLLALPNVDATQAFAFQVEFCAFVVLCAQRARLTGAT